MLGVGIVSRIAPLFDAERRLWQWATEDGYLMLTIAENVALGHGMTVSNGTVATNGTQPLCTWLWALAFTATSDRLLAVVLVQWAQVLFALASAVLLFTAGTRWLGGDERARRIAQVGAVAWFASPVVVPASMNCLETGLYGLLVLAVVSLLGTARRDTGGRSWMHCGALGLVLGLAFYARNDAVFLIAAVCLANWIVGARREGRWIGRALLESIVIGAITVVLALPWLAFNLTFGHLVPISGIAESLGAVLGGNLLLIPSKLFEYTSLFVPIPLEHEDRLFVTLLCTIVLGAVAYLVRLSWTRRAGIAEEALVVAIFAVALCSYYGVFFGAPHFVGRYLFPLSPFLALVWGRIVVAGAERLASHRPIVVLTAAVVVVVALANAMRQYDKGTNNGHRQVVEWVERNAEDGEWVGAIQSGTLGFFHAHTYNLDGKVSPEALEAHFAPGGIVRYFVEKTEIRHFVDWSGVGDFYRAHPEVRAHFDLVVEDRERNLGALVRRREPATPSLAP